MFRRNYSKSRECILQTLVFCDNFSGFVVLFRPWEINKISSFLKRQFTRSWRIFYTASDLFFFVLLCPIVRRSIFAMRHDVSKKTNYPREIKIFTLCHDALSFIFILGRLIYDLTCIICLYHIYK